MELNNKIKYVIILCGLSLSSAFAADFSPVNAASDQNTVDVAVLNNSGHTLTYASEQLGPDTQCTMALGGNTIAPGAYFIVRGVYNAQGGEGLSCQVKFAIDSNAQNTLILTIADPTQEYSGTAVFNIFDGGTEVSSNYVPVPYAVSPEELKDASATLILNSF